MVVESEVLKAQNSALSKFSLPMHSIGHVLDAGFWLVLGPPGRLVLFFFRIAGTLFRMK